MKTVLPRPFNRKTIAILPILQGREGCCSTVLLLRPGVQEAGHQNHAADADKLFLSLHQAGDLKPAQPRNML